MTSDKATAGEISINILKSNEARLETCGFNYGSVNFTFIFHDYTEKIENLNR